MLLVGLIKDANNWVYLGIPMQGNRLNEFNLEASILTSPREKIIKNLKNRKSPGFENIPNILLENLSLLKLLFS
jgi:hypothetical protein